MSVTQEFRTHNCSLSQCIRKQLNVSFVCLSVCDIDKKKCSLAFAVYPKLNNQLSDEIRAMMEVDVDGNPLPEICYHGRVLPAGTMDYIVWYEQIKDAEIADCFPLLQMSDVKIWHKVK